MILSKKTAKNSKENIPHIVNHDIHAKIKQL